jgi:hypothetical protein
MHPNDQQIQDIAEALHQIQQQLGQRSRRNWRIFSVIGIVTLCFGSIAGLSLQQPAVAASTHAGGGVVERIVAELHRDGQIAAHKISEIETALRSKEAAIEQHIGQIVATEIDKIRNELKKDERAASDWITAGPLHGIHVVLQDIHQVMGEVSIALQAMPQMSRDMNAMNFAMQEMNGKMGVMSHGVDSTMGRMGRLMPFPGRW